MKCPQKPSLMSPTITATAVCLAMASIAAAAESYQPSSNVTRGIYAHLPPLLQTSVWTGYKGPPQFVATQPHSGETCLYCPSRPDVKIQGAGQTVELKQTEPRSIKIAGWSRCQGVPGAKSYRYSLYVDFVFTDGTPWHMRTACFETGSHDWQYAETIVTPPKPLRSARFHAFLRDTQGEAWFDDLFLGEPDGKNLLLSPGFEKDNRVDLSRRKALYADLAKLHCNALHGYLGSGPDTWEQPPSADSPLLGLLRDARDHGIGVWLTLGLGHLPIRDANDPNFPQYDCVNGDWGKRWAELLAKAARYPFAGLSMVPDEYNWNTGRLREAFAKHPDAKVREFYAALGSYCNCPVCRERFAAQNGGPFPERLPHRLPSADLAYRRWLQFRYDSTTRWIANACQAVKRVNPTIRTDSLICVTPICSDFWYGPGLAWDRAGYEAGLEYPTTDPYILLHNYLGDSTHWYVTETAEHLAASSPARRCGVVLEGSRLRAESRELDPVEIYGPALSAVWHGARELAYFHHSVVMGQGHTTGRPEVSQAAIAGAYGLLEKIDPWLDGLTPEPGVALLFSRASCDFWRLYAEAKGQKPPFDTHGITAPRHASIMQKEALYYLLRTGLPTTLYYLDSVRPEELARHSTILVPFPLAVSTRQAQMLQQLAAEGKRVVIVGYDGPLDEMGTPHQQPALRGLVSETNWAKMEESRLAKKPGFAFSGHPVGKGQVVFVAADVLESLVTDRKNEKRTRTERLLPSPLNPDAATAFSAVLRGGRSQIPGPLLSRLPDGDDVELCCAVNCRGEKLLLAINWDGKPRSVALRDDPTFRTPPEEAYRLNADGRWSRWEGAFRPELQLQPGEVVVARFPARP